MLSSILGAAPAFGGAGTDQVALDIGQAPNTASIERPVLMPVSAHGSASERNCAFASHDAFDDAEQIEGTAREAVDPRHRHHVAGVQLAEHPVKLAPVGPGACRLLLVNIPAAASGGAKLLKLAVEGLPTVLTRV